MVMSSTISSISVPQAEMSLSLLDLLEAAPRTPPASPTIFTRHPNILFLITYYVLAIVLLDRSLPGFPSFLNLTHILSLITIFTVWYSGYRSFSPLNLAFILLAISLANHAAETRALFAIGWERGFQGVAVHGLAGLLCVNAGRQLWKLRGQQSHDESSQQVADASEHNQQTIDATGPEKCIPEKVNPSQQTLKPWNNPAVMALSMACYTCFAPGILARKNVPPVLRSTHVFVLLTVLGTLQYGWQRVTPPRRVALIWGVLILCSLPEFVVEAMKRGEHGMVFICFVMLYAGVSGLCTLLIVVSGIVAWWNGKFVGLLQKSRDEEVGSKEVQQATSGA
jgi:hypothetical protein